MQSRKTGVFTKAPSHRCKIHRKKQLQDVGSNHQKFATDPAGIYLLKDDNRNTRIRCEICPKLTIKNISEHISHLVLVFLLLTLSR